MSLNPNSRGSKQAQEPDDGSVLFEDEENEQFIKALEKSPKIPPVSSVDSKKVLDEILPDVEETEESNESLALNKTPEPASSFEKTTENYAPNEDLMSPISQTPIQIQLELGRVQCSLQKLIELQPNDVLTLEKPIGQMIDLRIDGRLIGRGQIVKLGNQLGLRISELAER
jgi:flagellar motor switch protein FliN/FliY